MTKFPLQTGEASPPPWARPAGDGCWHLFVQVQPGAKKNEVAGEAEGRLRLRIAARAVDNKANEAVVAFVAKLLGVRPGKVRLENGGTSRRKTLAVDAAKVNWNVSGGLCHP